MVSKSIEIFLITTPLGGAFSVSYLWFCIEYAQKMLDQVKGALVNKRGGVSNSATMFYFLKYSIIKLKIKRSRKIVTDKTKFLVR